MLLIVRLKQSLINKFLEVKQAVCESRCKEAIYIPSFLYFLLLDIDEQAIKKKYMKTTWFCFVFSLLFSCLIQAQPIVNLGVDTTHCGNSFTLDASNNGATFLWSTGAITQSITVNSSGIYWVDVTDLSGTTRDSIEITLITPPTLVTRSPDTSICQGVYQLNASSSTGLIEWMDSLGNILGYGDSILYNVQDTTTLYYQAKRYEAQNVTVGFPTTTSATGFASPDRGISFDVLETIVLNSVRINVNNASFSGFIYLLSPSGDTIGSQNFAPGVTGFSVATLDFLIPPGLGYVLQMSNITGGGAQFNNPVTTWNLFSYPFMRINGGAQFSGLYAYFYDWQVSTLSNFCASTLDSVVLAALETPIANLGADSIVCGDSLVLDATNIGTGFNYLWDDGTTNPLFTVNGTGAYKVTVSFGGACPVEDSIYITLNSKPIITQRAIDTSVCEGIYVASVSANGGVVQWLDSMGTVISLGDSIRYNVQDTVQLWYQSVFYEPHNTSIGLPNATAPTGFTAAARAIEFNVTESIVLNSVTINVNNAAFSGLIYLLSPSGDTIATQIAAPTQAGVNIIPLNFSILPGTGYLLGMTNVTGGLGQFNNPVTTWNLLGTSFLELIGGVPFVSVYAYFYDWQVSRVGTCTSDLDSVVLNRLVTPTVDLGMDTTLCSSTIILDVTNPGSNFSYVWSTTATTPSIVANSTGLYKVTVSANGACPVEDSLNLIVRNRPTLTQLPLDADVCEGRYTLIANSSEGVIQWLDSLGNTLALGDTFNYDVQDTARLWIQAGHYEESPINIGLPSTTNSTGFANLDRGIVFSTTEPLILNSVTLNVDNAAFTATILLQNLVGDTIATYVVTPPGQVGTYEVNVDFLIPTGVNYILSMTNIANGNAQFNNPITNWNLYNYTFIELTEGTPFAGVYAYFYDWNVSRLGDCISSLDSVVINLLETPVVDLGVDTSLCSSNLTLDATNIGNNFNYIWSTNATTPTIVVSTTGLYKVTVSSAGGSCPVEDSINILVRQQPIITQLAPDTSLCVGVHPIIADANSGVIQWLDSTGALLGLGDTLNYDVQDTVQLWYQSAFYEQDPTVVGLTNTTVPTGFVNVSRGIRFNVTEPIVLTSVSINVDDAAFSGVVFLVNPVGDTLYHQTIVAGQVGVNSIGLNFSLLPGVGYILGMTDITGGSAQFNNPITNWGVYNYPFLDLVEGIPFSAVYAYFYDWKISRLGNCASELDSVLLNKLETPVVNLPIDTVVCNDTLMLDVFNPGASYLWGNTGVTTSNITITQEGLYNVTASIGTCVDFDSIEVYLSPIPTITLLSTDTSTCVGEIPREAIGADFISWYTEPTSGNNIGNGSLFMYNAQVSDTIWCSGQNFANKVYTEGLIDSFVATQTGYFFPNQVRGLIFDAQEPILLKDVTMYINETSLIGTIELWDENDVVLNSQPIVLTSLGENIVPLGFTIPAGVDYKLMLTDYNTKAVLSEFPFSNFPVNGNYLNIKSGTPFPQVYQYFYKWNVQTLSCPTDRIPSVVEVLPTPNIDFPTDSVICGDTLILDASVLGLQSYLWSTGETTPDVTLDSSTTISLFGTIGICSDEDSMNVFIVEPPSLIIPPNDTTVCGGNVTFYAAGNAAYYAWYDTETGATPFALGDSVVINLQDTTRFWVEGIGFIPKSTPVGEQYNPNSNLNRWGEPQNSVYPTRGMNFNINVPVILNTVSMYVDTATTATLTIYKNSFTYYTQQITLPNVGENIVQIDTLLESGSYAIELSNKSAGKILFLSPYTNLGQLNTPEVTFVSSYPTVLGFQYNYFFNWKISTPSCATNRLPVDVTVPPSPQIDLAADTATCTLGSLTLDPIPNNNPSYTYLWSNNSTGDTLSVSSTGYYKVTVTNDGTCSATQDIYVQFLSTPNDPVVNDFSICAPQTVSIPVPVNDGIVVWYDSSDLNTVNYLTSPYDVYINDTTDFWVDVAPKATTRIGKQVYDNPDESNVYLNFIIPNRFDVHQYAVLDSVAIYVETVPANVDVVLMDSLGNPMNTISYTVNRAKEKVFIPLGFLIPPGANYQLSFSSINSLFLVDQTPIQAVSSSANIATLTGTIFSDYSYFFDWHFSYAYPDCHSNPDTFTVSVNIPVDIPDSVYTCDSITIDATHPNIVSYNWSNGLTTGLATFDNAGTYVLTITDGAACTIMDTMIVTQPTPVGLPLGNAACDFQLSTNYNLNNASFSWSTGDSTDIITIPSTGIYSVTVTTVGGCTLVDTTFISQIVSPPVPNLGNFVSGCFTDTLDAGFGGQGMTYLWSTGAISQQIIVNTSGVYAVTVTHPLGCIGSDFVSVTIDTAPKAAFTVTQSNRTILMTNLSTGTNQATDYFWEMGDGSTYQIPNPFHTYVDSGCYIIRLTVTDACGSDTDTLRIAVDVPDSSCTIGVNTIATTLEGINLSIVPNPNTGRFQLQLLESLKEKTNLQLYDLNGRVIHQQELPLSAQKNWEIETKNLSTGVYFLRLLNSKQSQTHRVLILKE